MASDREIIFTMCAGRGIQLLWRPEPVEIPEYIADGFIPIEMAEGQESFVDFRCLDHHNIYSHYPAACISALKHYGTAGNPARLMVNHTDADCVLTGLTLMGLLPLDVLKKFNPEVGLLDTDPFAADFSELAYGGVIRLWKAGMTSAKKSGWSWLYGLQLFLDIFRGAELYDEAKDKLAEKERERMAVALEDYEKAIAGSSGKVLLIAPSRVFGFDVQFGRKPEFPVNSQEGWRHLCIIAQVPVSGNVTLSCPNRSVAELAFGPGGLQNVYSKLPSLEGREWGGREAVGGSPRGVAVPEELLPAVLEVIEDALNDAVRDSHMRAVK